MDHNSREIDAGAGVMKTASQPVLVSATETIFDRFGFLHLF